MDNKVVLILLAIFIPPVAIIFKSGFGKHFWINILLCLLGGLPGIVHGLWIVLRD
ncbi:MAG: YqaE/Pmp3 family membrane protein [Anaerolineae bacterium]